MSINLIHAVNAAIPESVAEQLSQKFGIPAQIIQQTAARMAPGLVASLMDRSTLPHGVRAVYSVIMSPETNAFVAGQLANLVSTTSGLKHLETTGHSLAALACGQRIDALTDAASTETGVPAQATSALAGIVASLLFGVLKHHFLLSQARLADLPALMREQVGDVRMTMSPGIASAIGLGNTEGFCIGIPSRLDAVVSLLEHDEAEAPAPAASAVHAQPPARPAAAPASAAASVPLRAPVRARAQKRSNKWIWVLFAALAAILALVFYYGYKNQNTVELGADANAPAPAVVSEPASAVSAPGLVAGNGASAAAAASAANAAVNAKANAAANVAANAAASPPASATASEAAASAVTSAPVAADASTANWKDAQMLFGVSSAGTPSIQATVGTEAERKHLLDALTQRFGKNYSANVSIVPQTRPATWLARLNDFFPLMAVPNAEAKITGSKVELSGAAADAKLGWAARLKSALGGMFQVGSFDMDSAVANATQSFRSAMKSLIATDTPCSGNKLTQVLDLQVVNFARSSATVPSGAYSTLDDTARLLKECAAKGSMVKLDVAGYSDGVGSAAAKLEMSKERATAVRGYLVRAGVPGQSLSATGYGDANPIADNETESGRFKNRRIEFNVK